MPATIEFHQLKSDPEDKQSWLSIPFPNGNLIYHYYKDEHKPAMRFVRSGLGGFLKGRLKPIIIPPSEDDEETYVFDHFFGHCEHVFNRSYVTMIGRHRIVTSPALLLADTDTDVPDYLNQLDEIFGRALRIVPPNAIAKYWRGKLDEFDQIVWHDGKRYHRWPLRWRYQNDRVYASGIPVHRYLELLDTHPPDPQMAYEDYFQELRRKTKGGYIHTSPWPQEELYPKQPHLF